MKNDLMKTSASIKSLAEQLIQSRANSVKEFGSIEHRLEHVKSLNGIEYINDSKSTDLGAAEYSLEYVRKPIVWIIGESDLDEDYMQVKKLVMYKVRGIIAYGKDTSRISRALSNFVEYFLDVPNMEEAVKLSYSMSNEGEAVLFSPACSSHAAHENFKERGHAFCELVSGLEDPEGSYEGPGLYNEQ